MLVACIAKNIKGDLIISYNEIAYCIKLNVVEMSNTSYIIFKNAFHSWYQCQIEFANLVISSAMTWLGQQNLYYRWIEVFRVEDGTTKTLRLKIWMMQEQKFT